MNTNYEKNKGRSGTARTAPGTGSRPAAAAGSGSSSGTGGTRAGTDKTRNRMDTELYKTLKASGACYSCGKPGHQSKECPAKKAAVNVTEPEEPAEGRRNSSEN